LLLKAENIYKYYSNLLKSDKDPFNKLKFQNSYKEIHTFLIFSIIEIKTFRNSILKKNLKDKSKNEVIFIKLMKNLESQAFIFNFGAIDSNQLINFENPSFENYDKRLMEIEENLISMIKSQKELGNIPSHESLNKNESYVYLEKYFIKMAENSVISYQNKEFSCAYDELIVSKYLLECLIITKIIASDISIKEINLEELSKIFEDINFESYSSYFFEEKKQDKLPQLYIYSFLVSELKNTVTEKIIISDKNVDKFKLEYILQHYTKFYYDILKMLADCDKKANFNSLNSNEKLLK